MTFENFTNPFKDPASTPREYRIHPRLSKLFQPDGTYTRPLEDPVTLWAGDVLHREYSVPLEAMELEISVDFSEGTHQSGSGRRYRVYMSRVDNVGYDANGRLSVTENQASLPPEVADVIAIYSSKKRDDDDKRFWVELNNITGSRFDWKFYNREYARLIEFLRRRFGTKLVGRVSNELELFKGDRQIPVLPPDLAIRRERTQLK